MIFSRFNRSISVISQKYLYQRLHSPTDLLNLTYPPIYTAISWYHATECSNQQPLLIKKNALTATPHPHQSSNAKQHLYFVIYQ